MKMFNKPRNSLLAVAIASTVGSLALVSAPASAMNLADGGVGQVLLFPYYSVKDGWDSYIHLTNTANKTVIAKIRFREAKNSREVLDFNIVLSPYDQWTAAVTANGADGAQIVTYDSTCTSPILPADADGRRGQPFVSAGYDGTLRTGFDSNIATYDDNLNYDNGGINLSRTQEGYLEVIVMGVSADASAGVSTATVGQAGVVEWNAKHVAGANGKWVPRDCATVDSAFATGTIVNGYLGNEAQFAQFSMTDANVLKGFSSLINVANGDAVGVEPTVVANFATAVDDFDLTDNLIYEPGNEKPDLRYAAVTEAGLYIAPGVYPAARFNDVSGLFASVNYANSEDAVSALLMRSTVYNEFTSYAPGNTKTNWIVTFPTKHYYTDFTNGAYDNRLTYATAVGTVSAVDPIVVAAAPAADAPFAQSFWGTSCDNVTFGLYGREEESVVSQSNTQFSPRQPGAAGQQLCYEANVLTFNGQNLFSSAVSANVPVPAAIASGAGWGSLTLAGTGAGVSGLPAIGFAVHNRNNEAEAGNNRNYGTSQSHGYTQGALPGL